MFLLFFQKFSLVLVFIGSVVSTSSVEVKLVSAAITTAAVGSAPKPYMIWTIGGTSKTSSTVTPATYNPTWNENAMIWSSVTDTSLESVVFEMWDEYSSLIPDVKLTTTVWNISTFKSPSTSRARKTVSLYRSSDGNSATGGTVSVDIAVICTTCSTLQQCCTGCETGIYSGLSGCSCSNTNGVCSCGGTSCSNAPATCSSSNCAAAACNSVSACGGASGCYWDCSDSTCASTKYPNGCSSCPAQTNCTANGCYWSSGSCSSTAVSSCTNNAVVSSSACTCGSGASGGCGVGKYCSGSTCSSVCTSGAVVSGSACQCGTSSPQSCSVGSTCSGSTCTPGTTPVCDSVCSNCNASSTQCYSSTNANGDCWWSSTFGCRDSDDYPSCSVSDTCSTCKSKYECTVKSGCAWSTSSNTCSGTTSDTCSGTDCFTCPTHASCTGKSGCTWSGTACEVSSSGPCAGPQCTSCSSSQKCLENGCWWTNNSCTTGGLYAGYDVLDLLTQELVTCGDIVGPYIQYCDHFPVCYRSGDQCLYDYCTYGLLYLHQSMYTQIDCDGVSSMIASLSLGNVDCAPVSWRGWSTCHQPANRIDQCFDVATTAQLAQTCSGSDGCYSFTFDVPELGAANARGCWNVSTGGSEGPGGGGGDNSAARSIRISYIYMAFALIAALLLLN